MSGTVGSIFDDPLTAGLLGAAQGFAQAAMPSRMPIPFGAALGMGGGGALQGEMQALQGQKAAQEAQQLRLNNALMQASLPARVAMLQSVFGNGGGAPFGVPGGTPGGPASGATPVSSGGFTGQEASPNYMFGPSDILSRGNLALALGQDRAAASLYGLLGPLAGGAGYYMGADNRAHFTPGGSMDPNVIAGREYAKEQAGVGPALQKEWYAPHTVAPGGAVVVPGGTGPLWQQNDNPGNLRFAAQPGAQPGAKGFAAFPDMQTGIDNIYRQLALYQQRGINTPAQMISAYAPPSENNTSGYIANVSLWSGLKPNEPIDMRNPQQAIPLVSAIVRQETGGKFNDQQAIQQGFARAFSPVMAQNASTQTPAAAGPGVLYQNTTSPLTINMGRPAAEEVYKGLAAEDAKETAEEMAKARELAPTLGQTSVIRNYLPNVRTGVGTEALLDLGRAMAGIGVDPDRVKALTGIDPSQGELLTKSLFNLTASRVRAMGAREPGSLVFAFLKAFPNPESRPETTYAMTMGMDADYLYRLDRATAMRAYLNNSVNDMARTNQYKGLSGFDQEFAKTNDPRVYAAAAETAAGFKDGDAFRGLTPEQIDQARGIAQRLYPGDYDPRPGALNGWARIQSERAPQQAAATTAAPTASEPPAGAIAKLRELGPAGVRAFEEFWPGQAAKYLAAPAQAAPAPVASRPSGPIMPAPQPLPQTGAINAAPIPPRSSGPIMPLPPQLPQSGAINMPPARGPAVAAPPAVPGAPALAVTGNPMAASLGPGYRQPSALAVQLLRAGRLTPAGFDSVYGRGAAALVLGQQR